MPGQVSLADAERTTRITYQPLPEAGSSAFERDDERFLAHDFAVALSRSGRGFRIHSDNTSGGWNDLWSLAQEDCAYAVLPRARFLSIDLDVEGVSPEDVQRRRAAFESLRNAAAEASIGTVLVQSGRPGHKHLILALGTSAPSLREGIESLCRRVGLDVRSRGLRPPFVRHRAGMRSTVAGCPKRALEILSGPAASRDQVRHMARLLGVGGLSSRMERVLREGHAAGGYESPSHARLAFAIAAVGAGRGQEYIASALSDPENLLGETFRRRSSRWQLAEVERIWSFALTRQGHWRTPKIRNRVEALQQVVGWIAALDHDVWHRTAGTTDRAVCEAVGRISYAQGGVDFSASLAVIAVAAGVCDSTARNSLHRLIKKGWLKVLEAPTATTSTRYRLTLPEQLELSHVASEARGAQGGVDPLTGAPVGLQLGDDLGIDAARWGALGKAAMLAWRELSSGAPMLTQEVADRLRISHNAARLRLRKLSRHGLARYANGRWQRLMHDFVEIARCLGTEGKRQSQVTELLRRRSQRMDLRESWRRAFRELKNLVAEDDAQCPRWIAEAVPARVLTNWLQRFGRSKPLSS